MRWFGGFKSAAMWATGARACERPPGDATETEADATAAPLPTAQSIDWPSLGEVE